MAQSPLFDMFGEEDEVLGLLPLRRNRRIEDLMSEEEQASMLQNLAYAGASGLSGFGWLLDTPGAVIRGGLSGGPLKALSALWETTDERVTGRELARQYGLAGEEDNWGNFAGGLATEIALDPLTYLSLGLAPLLGGVAKTAAGKAAQKAAMFTGDLGLMAKQAVDKGLRPAGYGRMMLQRETPEAYLRMLDDIDPARAAELRRNFRAVAGDQADELSKQRMSASNRLSIPGLYDGAFDMFGQRAGDRITQAADWIGQAAQQTPVLGPALRNLRGMFWSPTRGQTTEAGQWMARREAEAERLGERAANRFLGPTMAEAALRVGMDRWQNTEFKRQFSDAFGLAMENQQATEAWRALPEEIRNLFDGDGGGSYLVDAARRFQEAKIYRARALGLPLADADLPFDIGFLSRQKAYPGSPRMPPGYEPSIARNLDTGTELFGLSGEASRRDWTRPFPRWVLDKMARDPKFQDQLRAFSDNESMVAVQESIDEWLRREAPDYWARTEDGDLAGPFSYLRKDLEEGSDEATRALARERELYKELADSIASLPLNYAEEGLPFYGDALTDFIRYARSRGRTERVGPALIDELAKAALRSPRTPSFSSYTAREALEKLGFNLTAGQKLDEAGNIVERGNAERLLAEAIGANANVATSGRVLDVAGYINDLDTLRVPQDLIESLKSGVQRASTPTEAQGLLKKYDQFLQSFKSLALLFPSRYTRDMYSGSFAGATQGLFSPLDSYAGIQAGRGNYKPLARRLRQAPGYENLTDEQAIRKFLGDSGAERLTDFNIADDLSRDASNLTTPDVFPGSAGPYTQSVRDKFRRQRNPLAITEIGPDGKRRLSRSNLFWAQRNRAGNPNWLLEAGDSAATASDSWNRIGTYLTAIRQGYTPEAAKAMSDLTQVVYRPEAFTSFERDVIKRLVPFYSYTKGIAPLVADNLINQPAGLMGQSIRLVNRAGEPSEDRFVPEYLRQSAAIPLSEDIPVIGPLLGLDTPGVTRFLTNIDLPHEGLLNLFTPGLGNTLTSQVANSVMRTGQNLLGQMTPAFKGPLEYILDRQFYTGRQLSDLYSMLEHDFGSVGRPLEQAIANAPGGSRILGLIRQARDERISPSERAAKMLFNTLTGMKLQDVDQDRTVRLAARSALNELLNQAEGIGTYENLFIKNEDLLKLSPQEQRQYLLYRVLQSRASREARERKKAEALADPMQMLGVD